MRVAQKFQEVDAMSVEKMRVPLKCP